MKEAGIVASQVLVMFSLIGVGYFLYIKKWLKEEAVSSLNHLVVYIAGPAIMIRSFNVAFSPQRLKEMAMAVVLSFAVMIIAIVISQLFFPKKDAIGRFAVVFNNCGFIGIPLVQAILGEEAIFYLTILMAVWNLFSWTYGIVLLSHDSSYASVKKILVNPATISVAIGMVLFFTPIKLPSILDDSLLYLGNMNTPLGMLVLGTYLVQADFSQVLKSPKIWKITLFRLVIIPLATILLFMAVPDSFNLVRYTMVIAACTPTGATLTMFLKMLDQKVGYGSLLVSFTTLCSLITIPLLLTLASVLWM